MEIMKLLWQVPLFGELLWQVPFLQNGKKKPLKSNFKMLKLKSDSLFRKRDAISKKIVMELKDGKIPTKDCHRWLKKVPEIQQEVSDILKFEEKSYQLDVSKHMQLQDRLLHLLNEIAECLDASPQQNGTVADAAAAHGRSKRIIKVIRIGSNKYQTLEIRRRQKMQRKADDQIGDVSSEANVSRRHIAQWNEDVTMMGEPSIPVSETTNIGVKGGSAPSASTLLGKPLMGSNLGRPDEKEIDESEMALNLENADETPSTSEEKVEIVLHSDIEASPPKENRNSKIGSPFPGIASSNSEAAGSTLVKATALQMKNKSNKNLKTSIQFDKGFVLSTTSRSRKKDAPELEKLASQEEIGRSFSVGKPKKKIYPRTKYELHESEKNTKATIGSMVQKVIEFIKDDKVRTIGIHGKGGIGKTTVLNTLVNCPEIQCEFDLVIQVTVSRYWSMKKIQNEVSRQIGILLVDTNVDPADRIFHALQSRNYLLLLDDIWESIDLEAIGIPQPGPDNHSRIIVATRSAEICKAMAPDGQIELRVLYREEALNLFQEQVGNFIDSADIMPYANAIVSECSGLPLLIIVIGKALANEGDSLVWRLVLSKLLSVNESKSDGTEDESESIIQQLKVGYDRLQTHDLKSCFLYCALFPEDHHIRIAELINYWIQEGIIIGNSISALKKGYRIVRHLAEASLVEFVDGGTSIKMHDMMRDLASWIILSDANSYQLLIGRKFTSTAKPDRVLEQKLLPVPKSSATGPSKAEETSGTSSLNHLLLSSAGGGLKKPPEEEEWEESEMIFLMDNNFSLLPERPKCLKLRALFLQRNIRLATIPDTFFHSMPCLQVLNLSKASIRYLPPSLFELRRLHALILRHCECLSEIPPEIGNLKLIEILDLRGTEIYSLPHTIGNLSFLKHLHLSFYGCFDDTLPRNLQKSLFPRDVLLKLQALEELSIFVQPGDPRWDRDAEFVTQELCTLHKLNTVNICFPKAKYLSYFINSSPVWKADSLGKFKFVIGNNIKSLVSCVPKNVEVDFDEEDRCLRCVNATDGQVLEEVKKVLTRATAFYLDHQSSIRSLSDFGIVNLRQLKCCILRECPDLVTIVDGSESNESALPHLGHLSLHYLWNLKSIWESLIPDASFSLLKTLSVHTCPQLEFVLSQAMLPYLPNLEDLTVEDCASLTEVIKSDVMIEVGVTELPKLQRLELQYLPQLVRICHGSYQSIKQINIEDCPNLQANIF